MVMGASREQGIVAVLSHLPPFLPRPVQLTGCMHLVAPPRLDPATHKCRRWVEALVRDAILLLLLYPLFRYGPDGPYPFHIISCNQSIIHH
jgi:hypothetical protein